MRLSEIPSVTETAVVHLAGGIRWNDEQNYASPVLILHRCLFW